MSRILLAAFAFLTAACSTTGSLSVQTPITDDLGRYESISVAMETKKGEVEDETLREIGQKLADRIQASGRFSKASASTNADLKLVVVAVNLPPNGLWANRSIFAKGEARFEVELIESASGRSLGACETNGQARLGALWTSTGNRAINKALEKIVEFILSSKSYARPGTRTERGVPW